MTIDETIKNHKKLKIFAEGTNDKRGAFYSAEEHEQLAEWLELLKWYQQGMEDIPSESGILPKDVYHAGYNKALNDFVNVCEKQFTTMYGQRYLDMRDIKNIAEQLKVGGKNERSI